MRGSVLVDLFPPVYLVEPAGSQCRYTIRCASIGAFMGIGMLYLVVPGCSEKKSSRQKCPTNMVLGPRCLP